MATQNADEPAAFSPQTVQDMAIREHPEHYVFCCCVVNEGPLRVHKEHIGHPNLLHQPAIEGHALICAAREGQALIFPVVPEVKRHGEVLNHKAKDSLLIHMLNSDHDEKILAAY